MRMRINNVAKSVRFDSLSVGEIFSVNSFGDVFIKIEEIQASEDSLVVGTFNAVTLNNGHLRYFIDRDTVKIVDATLTVKEVLE